MYGDKLLEQFGINVSIEYNVDVLLRQYLKDSFSFKDYDILTNKENQINCIKIDMKYDLNEVVKWIQQIRYNIWCNIFNQMCSSDKAMRMLYRVDFYTCDNEITEPFNQQSNFESRIFLDLNEYKYYIELYRVLYPIFMKEIHETLYNNFDHIRIIDMEKRGIHIHTYANQDEYYVFKSPNEVLRSFSEDPNKCCIEMSFYYNKQYKLCGSFVNNIKEDLKGDN